MLVTMDRLKDNGRPKLVIKLSKNHPDEDKIKNEYGIDTKEKSRCLKPKKDNPFLRIIQDMNDDKPDEDKHEEQAPIPPQLYSEMQSANSKNLTTLPGPAKRKLSPELDSPNVKKSKITPSDSKKQPPLEKSCKADSGNNDEGLKSVLVFVRSKPSRKSVSWKAETDLVEVSYFEHDPTERVNVNRTFKAMKMQEREIERRNFLAARKLNADYMEPKTAWRSLDDSLLIDIPESGYDKIEPGRESLEKKKQTYREQYVLQAIYNTRDLIPDSPEEPDEMEIFPYSEALNIPFEDMSGGTLSIYNYVDIPWPEYKSEQPTLVEVMQQQQFPVSSENQMKQQPIPLHPQHQRHRFSPHHYDLMIPWMGQSVRPMQHDLYWDQQYRRIENVVPYFEQGGGSDGGCGRGHIRLENYSDGGNCESYRGKMNRGYQRGNSGRLFNCRGGHLGNRRVNRLCKFYAKQGVCKKTNCTFLHNNS